MGSRGGLVEPRGERKLVSILFVDLVGYTALSASLDPEEVYRFLRPGILALQRIVEEYGGTVPQILGDGFMAVFGVPMSHEDDPERAVRAAIAVRTHVAEMNTHRRGLRFPEIHAGVNSGEVMVAPSEEPAGFAVIGDTVNTASRLADLAGAGSILVDERTRSITRHAIRYGPRRDRRAKGKAAPIATFEALEALPPAATRSAGRSVFVDRRDALERIRSEVQATTQSGRSRVLLVIGEPGAGKSRLAEEIRRRRVGSVVIARCPALGAQLPLHPVAGCIGSLLELDLRPSRRDIDAAAARLAQGIRGADRAGFGRRLRQLLGEESPAPRAAHDALAETVRTARLAFAALTRSGPVVVVLDDLHRADEGTIAFLLDVHRAPVSAPVLFLGLTRPGHGIRSVPRTELGLIGDEHMRDLARAVAGGDLPADALATTLKRAEGNPLFLEETLGVLVESGALGPSAEGGLTIVDPEGLSAVPSTIRSLIAARLDGLSPAEKRVMQDLAVAGDSATEELLEDLGEVASVRGAVRSLERRGLVVRGPLGPEVKHVLIRDVAYESLPRSERAHRHARIADHLRHGSTSGSRDVFASIAHHYERAWVLGMSRAGPAPDPSIAVWAVSYLGRWAEQAFAYQARLAESVFERAVSVARSAAVEPRTVARLLVGRAESLIEMGRHREAVVDASEALSTAEREGDRALAAGALLALGRSENDLGRSERARTLLARARLAFRDEKDVRGEAWTLHRLSETWSGVDYGRELRDLRLAYGLFSRARDRAGSSVTAQDLAYLLSLKGDAEFRSWYARSRRLTEDEGDLRSRAALARTTGYHAYYRGRFVAAMTAMDEARPLAAQCGDRYAEADAVFIRALAASAIGSPAAVEASVQELLRFASELGSSRLRVLALLVGARASLRAGRSGEASRRLATALRLVERRRMTIVGVDADATRAWLALDRGEFSSVAPAATRTAAAARRNGWDLWSSIGPLLRGRALLGAGRPARAARELGRAADLARNSGADGTERLARLLRGQCLVVLGRPSPAVRPFGDDPEHRALTHELAAVRHLGRGRPEAALAELDYAVVQWRSMGLTSWLARALALRAVSAREAGELSIARTLDAEARDVLRTIRTPPDERPALLAPI